MLIGKGYRTARRKSNHCEAMAGMRIRPLTRGDGLCHNIALGRDNEHRRAGHLHATRPDVFAVTRRVKSGSAYDARGNGKTRDCP